MIKGKCSNLLKDYHMLYGTAWKKSQTAKLVVEAFEAGFRGVDTACQPKHYQEDLVGQALQHLISSGRCKREDIWVQTKFTSLDGQDPNRIPYDKTKPPVEQVKESIQVSRSNLGLETIDSLVLHSPMRGGIQATLDVWREMEEGVDQNFIQILGISNCYDLEFFTQLYNSVRHKPKVLQNRFYSDSNWDNDLRMFCLQNGVVYQSFWTLTANPSLLRHSVVAEMSRNYEITAQQVLYKFLVDLGHQPLTGCKGKNHVEEAVAVKGLGRFKEEELIAIKKLIGDKHPLVSSQRN